MKKSELLADYSMLDKMSKDLAVHQKNVKAIGKRIASRTKSDLKFGLEENLDIVLEHMNKAQKELDRARKELKLI